MIQRILAFLSFLHLFTYCVFASGPEEMNIFHTSYLDFLNQPKCSEALSKKQPANIHEAIRFIFEEPLARDSSSLSLPDFDRQNSSIEALKQIPVQVKIYFANLSSDTTVEFNLSGQNSQVEISTTDGTTIDSQTQLWLKSIYNALRVTLVSKPKWQRYILNSQKSGLTTQARAITFTLSFTKHKKLPIDFILTLPNAIDVALLIPLSIEASVSVSSPQYPDLYTKKTIVGNQIKLNLMKPLLQGCHDLRILDFLKAN